MLAKTFGSALHGVDATIITVEVSEGQGQLFFIVGLPDGAVKESTHRVESAIKQVGYFSPVQKLWLILPLRTFARRVRRMICPLLWA